MRYSRFNTIQNTTQALGTALAARDKTTWLHCQRTAYYAEEIGKRCKLKSDTLFLLKVAALLHDIGMIGISDKLLLKSVKLNIEEFNEIKSHSLIGSRILSEIEVSKRSKIAVAVRYHHENFDGSGYPEGLAGEDIPLFSRIISIADSYDAMLGPRLYAPSRAHEDVLQIMYGEKGGKYDPALFRVFLEVISDASKRIFGMFN